MDKDISKLKRPEKLKIEKMSSNYYYYYYYILPSFIFKLEFTISSTLGAIILV
jgi:hypothetical protein